MSELQLQIDGAVVAGRLHGDAASPTRILCVHGQVDNAASFDGLGPLLAAAGHLVFAPDLTGHGRSSWRPIYDPTAWALEVLQVLDALSWTSPVVLLGHSFGTAIVTILAGAFPERVAGVILIEGLGLWPSYVPPAGEQDPSPSAVLRRRLGMAVLKGNDRESYAAVADGIQARLAQLRTFPNGISISVEAASRIVSRGMMQRADGRFMFSHDPAVYSGTFLQKLSDEDARDFLSRMPPRCLLIHCGQRTYPDIPVRTEARREAVRGLEVLTFEAESHHLHADRPDLVAPAMLRFLDACWPVPGGGGEGRAGLPRARL